MYGAVRDDLRARLAGLEEDGLLKRELVMTTPQGSHVGVAERGALLNLCANNYLGLANHPEMVAAAHEALDRWGYGMASVRFICGTQELHRDLEEHLSEFLGTEDTILFGSCFDANGGVFEALLDENDAVISDQLNHASIIDGIRLCKARRLRYANGDMDELEARLQESSDARFRLIATDGVFSMDGYAAKLDEICDLAERHDALVLVDDSHAVGFVGPAGAWARTRSSTSSSGSTSSPGRSARRSAARAGGTCPAGRRSWTSCASAPGRISSRTASPPSSSARASALST